MTRQIVLFVLFLLIWSKSQNQQLVLTHVAVIDVLKGDVLKDVSVVIDSNRIAEIGKKVNISSNARIINAWGKYLIPGLWDMHVHLSYYGEKALGMLVANGITGVRDMGGNLGEIDRWRNEIDSGVRIGPRIKRAGPFIDGQKKMDLLRASFTKIPRNEIEARSLVDSLKSVGVDFVKIHSRLPRSIFFAVADQARKQHIPIAVHVPKDVLPQEVARSGARSIEHTESLLGDAIYEEQELVREKRTNEALHRLYGAYGQKLAAYIADSKSFYSPTLISLYKVKGTDYEKTLAAKLLPIVTVLHKAKIPLLAGSDFATVEAGIRPGYDLHGELSLFIQAGISPIEALQSATINPVKCLYIDDSLGSIETGKIADLVLLNGNPVSNIKNSANIYAVILNGKYLSRRELDKLLSKSE